MKYHAPERTHLTWDSTPPSSPTPCLRTGNNTIKALLAPPVHRAAGHQPLWHDSGVVHTHSIPIREIGIMTSPAVFIPANASINCCWANSTRVFQRLVLVPKGQHQIQLKFLQCFLPIDGEGHGNPLLYPCLENPMDRGALWLQSIGSQRVRHNWNTWACTHAVIYVYFSIYILYFSKNFT